MTETQLDKLELTDDPETQNAVFLAAFNSGRGDLFDSLYRADAISNLSGSPLTGAARTEAITQLLAGRPRLSSVVRHSWVAGDTSLIIVAFDLEVTGPDGTKQRIRGRCTDVLVREPDGSWMMAVDRPVAEHTETVAA
jgi:ketosteroid isomerase-like protein